MDAEAGIPLLPHDRKWDLKGFAVSVAGLTTALLGFMTFFSEYSKEATDKHVDQYYSYLTDVYVMIFLGFGLLMTFTKRYSYSAISFNFVASTLVILEAAIVIGFAQQGFGVISIDLPLLIDCAFCAGAAMISFGAVLGKISPAQIIWLLALEVPIYAANAQLVSSYLGVLDVGGSLTIHAYGCFYGLAAAYLLCPPGSGASHPKNGASYNSDMTAMVGTIFLFIFWPSFNGALASAPDDISHIQGYCIMNTVLALLGSCLAAFTASAALEGKFDMVHIQNATLAGGVAIGSSASFLLPPAAALSVGIFAGLLSTVGYVIASPFLERTLGIFDTCGVFNLHGMPGVLGGLASALFSAVFYHSNSQLMAHGAKKQPLYQLLGLAITLIAAIVGGLAAGFIVKYVKVGVQQTLEEDELFEDAVFWAEVAHED